MKYIIKLYKKIIYHNIYLEQKKVAIFFLQLISNNVNFIDRLINRQMSKTAIDFFSKGLEGHKTKLSVSVFDLDIKCQIRQMVLKRKTSLSHFNFCKTDKKTDKQQMGYLTEGHKQKKLGSTISSFQSCNLSPSKKNTNKNDNKSLELQRFQQSRDIISIESTRYLSDTKLKMPFLLGGENKSKNKFQSIVRITEVHEQSFGSNIEIDKYQNNVTQQNQSIRMEINPSARFSESQEIQKKKNYYFISNMVLETTNQPQKNKFLQYTREHRLQMRKTGTPNIRYLQNIKINLATHRKQDKKEGVKLPNSLKTKQIVYFSSNEKGKKKQRSKKSILLPPQSKSPKTMKDVQYGIDRWEYKKQEVHGWDF